MRRRTLGWLIITCIGLTCIAASFCVSGPFQLVIDTPELSFPKDHGQHPGFQSEWWYVSGQLEAPRGAKWGYQFTIFRHVPAKRLFNDTYLRLPYNMYLGHLVLTNVSESQFVFFEKLAPSLFGAGGASEDGLGVWLGKWKLEESQHQIMLHASQEEFTVSLKMVPTKPVVAHCERGLCQASSSPDLVNYHYSMTSLDTLGEIEWQGERTPVTGKSWLDRDFFSGKRSENLRGWDWFSLMLNNSCDIMLATIRSEDGTVMLTSYGAIIQADGTYRKLGLEDFQVEPVDFWTSEKTKAVYPTGWEVHIPSEDLKLVVNSLIKDHELVASSIPNIDYWEGPVKTKGWMGKTAVIGKGYAELTGYALSIAGKF